MEDCGEACILVHLPCFIQSPMTSGPGVLVHLLALYSGRLLVGRMLEVNSLFPKEAALN